MASIYDILGYDSNKTYEKNDIVKNGGYYWYALQPVPTSNAPPTPGDSSGYWGGVIEAALTTHSAGPTSTKPYFFWKPAYGVQVNNAPRVQTIKYGDGYEQRFKDGIFNNLLNISLNFSGRNEREATAISHFLDEKEGMDDFFFTPPSPHQNIRKFICKEWQTIMEFNDSYNISVTFQQVP